MFMASATMWVTLKWRSSLVNYPVKILTWPPEEVFFLPCVMLELFSKQQLPFFQGCQVIHSIHWSYVAQWVEKHLEVLIRMPDLKCVGGCSKKKVTNKMSSEYFGW